eukprot:TRINITY_DN8683_c0_g2_i1.p1 TRINITY_DN8683_c0_g2~~TRINITY_DN8683_c0_g2_i1.p1  ORF type:complete len:108 (-),score=12.78 TRINITY_DN8683_c0_g2_i1:51-374(-)
MRFRKPGRIGGGGIMSNHEGAILDSFSIFLGEGPNNEAEIKVVEFSIRLSIGNPGGLLYHQRRFQVRHCMDQGYCKNSVEICFRSGLDSESVIGEEFHDLSSSQIGE